MRENVLPSFAGGINLQVRFLVLNCPTSYNIILGRLWIHAMKAVPSIYHLIVKFPTPWGVGEIKGDQRIAKECYKEIMKITAKAPPAANVA